MLRDPNFICRADDVVVEFGNSRLQKLADIYGAGGTLSETDIESMWREIPCRSPGTRRCIAAVAA